LIAINANKISFPIQGTGLKPMQKIWSEVTMQRLFCTFGATLALAASPAFAQEAEAPPPVDQEKINVVIVYGQDECAPSTEDQINVCARLSEGDRYRIPKSLRDDPNNIRKEAWTQKVLAYEYVGREGIQSCSATGAGGFTGCGLKEIDAAYAEKQEDPGLAFGRLIAAERKKRLAAIDAEAELVEERVKQFEKERAEREARLAGEGAEDAVTGGEALPEPK
jgi:uncharacterized membrane protein